MMNNRELEVFENLPSRVEIHRGTDVNNESGLSYTLKRSRAEWFAKRFNSEFPVVISREVSKAYCLAYLDSRGEEEIIIHPCILNWEETETLIELANCEAE